jgi:hypothetical protein
MIARVENLPRVVVKRAAPDVAEVVEAELRRTIAAGTTSDGKAWAPREDGGKPLATAADSLVVVPVGTRILARLRGHVARHHRGIARGGIERPILPTKITPQLGAKIRDVILEHAHKAVTHG